LADLLDARAYCAWDMVSRHAPAVMAYMVAHSVLCGKEAINLALEAAFEQAEQDARERWQEDDGRGDYLYQCRKDEH